jgi:hypothetical protein
MASLFVDDGVVEIYHNISVDGDQAADIDAQIIVHHEIAHDLPVPFPGP